MGGAKTCQAEAYPRITQIIHLNLCDLWVKHEYEFFSKTSGTKATIRLSKEQPVREWANIVNCSGSRPRG